ncbi:MAG TPA: diguanylate cyclase, partial [Solirubrobacteraceae bacterium]
MPGRAQANLLLVDDRPENLLALEAILEPLGENLVRAESGEAALRAMLHQEFAVILLDVQMPGMDGYETAALIKSRERTRHVPIIFLTAIDTDDRAARRGYGAGAVDYLFKPFDPVVLRSKVSVFIDLYHLKREAEDLAHRALHDPLTGLPNRVLFRDRLEIALARTRRLPSSVGVFYIDLDGFKPVNDSLGHEAGDELLVELAARLRTVLRPADTVARLGGDEFAVLSDAIDGPVAAADIAERVIAAISQPFDVARGRAHVTGSVGIALAGQPSDPEALLRAADQSMYAAKGAGGSCWRLHDIENRLVRTDFEVELIPRARLSDGGWAGYGVRLRRPDGELVEIDALDAPTAAAALHAAIRAADGEPVAVPAAPALLPDLSGAVRDALSLTAATPEDVCLEIPDASLRSPAPALLDAIEDTAALGVRVGVRGSGGGGAALATLARLPLATLSLDPALDAVAARATVAVARALGALAVAVEVDAPAGLESAREAGCDVVQGAAAPAPAPAPA